MSRTVKSVPKVVPYLRGPSSFAAVSETLSPAARRTLGRRIETMLRAIAPDVEMAPDQHADAIGDLVAGDASHLWLAHAVLSAQLPSEEQVAELLVRARLSGPWAALGSVASRIDDGRRHREVEVRPGGVTCDVHTTTQSRLLSGIQRVVRETATRWHATKPVTFVGWTSDMTGMRPLRDAEGRRLFQETIVATASAGVPPVIVPWNATHLSIEVVDDLRRSNRVAAMARHAPVHLGVLGYDSIPVTSASTVDRGTTAFFSRSLAASRQADRVAMISRAAAEEFRGVIDMGGGRRDRGPDVTSVPLAVQAKGSTESDLQQARSGLIVGRRPMVLVVGSHEPRKNHLAILHVAEMLWREGVDFSLVFVGAGSWNAVEYEQNIDALLAAGRPVQSIRGLPDRLLWAAYRLAHVTLFPSLNEGFGLPVAESLAAGTPVITSAFGSMRDIVAPHGTALGGLLVDPRDNASITDALRAILTDTDLHARLKDETAQHETRTWDVYAEELWSYLVDGVRPTGDPSDPPA